MGNIIEFQHVSYRFEAEEADRSLIMEDLTFSIEKGSFVGVVGRNGSGKSTMAKLCNAIYLPNGGRVLVNGMDTADEDSKLAVRQTVGMVFQDPDNQIVATTVEEDVAFGPENLGIPPKEIRRRVDDALEVVGMTQYARHQPHKLSGGQKQRVAIAGIIAMQPECIVLDEPTAMLDPQGRIEVLSTIRRLNRDYGITILLITHYMEEAASADRLMVMDHGKILLDDTPREVFRHAELLKSVWLDVPQVTELADRLSRQGMPVGQNPLTTQELVDNLADLLSAPPAGHTD